MRRRDFLGLGIGSGLSGIGLSQILGMRAQAAAATGKASPKDVRCIFIWLDGGPTHHESFDPKPDAASEIRGEYGTVKTSIPGVRFSDCIPRLAKAADKFSVVRSICHKDPNHGGGNHYMMTGCPDASAGQLRRLRQFPPLVRLRSFHTPARHPGRGCRPYMSAAATSPDLVDRTSSVPNMHRSSSAAIRIAAGFRVRDVVLPKAT